MLHGYDLVMFGLDGTLAEAYSASVRGSATVCSGHAAPQALAQASPEATLENVDARRRWARGAWPGARSPHAQSEIPEVEECAT